MNNIIELKNLSKSFVEKKNVKVLKNINYKFKLGKIYSLMGPSGSGKSTLLNIISLIDRPSFGLIKFQNNSIDFNKNQENDLFRANNIGIIDSGYRGHIMVPVDNHSNEDYIIKNGERLFQLVHPSLKPSFLFALNRYYYYLSLSFLSTPTLSSSTFWAYLGVFRFLIKSRHYFFLSILAKASLISSSVKTPSSK